MFREEKVYSQNGEDGVLFALLKVVKNRTYLEIGVEDGTECNTRIINEAPLSSYGQMSSKQLSSDSKSAEARKQEMRRSPWMRGWKGIQLDGGHENPEIGLYKETVTINSIKNIVEKYDVNPDLGVLSIDIDYNDLYVARVLFDECKLLPAVVIAEFNPILGLEDKMVIHDSGYHWKKGEYMGNSIHCVNKFYSSRGYTMVFATCVNAFFVRNTSSPHPSPAVIQRWVDDSIKINPRFTKTIHFIKGNIMGRKFVTYNQAMDIKFIEETERVRCDIDIAVRKFPHFTELAKNYKLKKWNVVDKLKDQLAAYLREQIADSVIASTLIINTLVCLTRLF